MALDWAMPEPTAAAAASSSKLASTASMMRECRAQMMALKVPSRTKPPRNETDNTWGRPSMAEIMGRTADILKCL